MMIEDDYAVVFSGGGALGAWEVGCLYAVIDHHQGKLPTVITGASAGAINAAGLCAGMSVDELASTWADLTDSDIYSVRSFRPQLVGAALGFLVGQGVIQSVSNQLHKLQSIYDTSPLEQTLRTILRDRENTFLSSNIAFAISTTKLADSQPELFYKMPLGQLLPPEAASGKYEKAWTPILGLTQLLQALKGTSALPVLFPPMEGRFDGGVLLNQPISPAIRLGAKNLYVFIPSVTQIGDTRDLLAIGSTLLSVWLAMSLTAQIEQIKLRNLIRSYTGDEPLRVCVVRPGLDLGEDPGVGLLSFGTKVGELIALGRRSAVDRLSRFDPGNANTWY
jgi:predicted acylesterase/phospholipase RssA